MSFCFLVRDIKEQIVQLTASASSIENTTHLQVKINGRNILHLSLACKEMKELCASYRSTLQKMDFIFSTKLNEVPKEVANALGGYEKMLKLSVLSTANRYNDYLDFFQPCDMQNSIMRGLDNWKRPFVSFKIISTDKEESIFTLFKRYPHENTWQVCFSHPHPYYRDQLQNYFALKTSYPSEEFIEFLKKLLRKNSIPIKPPSATDSEASIMLAS